MAIIQVAILVLIATATAYIVFPALIKILWRRRFLNAIADNPVVCLTFDDGPGPNTPQILQVLEEYGAKATFFVLGKNVETHPEFAQDIVAQGHEIGTHGYRHDHPWLSGPLRSVTDMIKAVKIIQSLAAEDARLPFRPPYGKLNLASLFYFWITRRRLAFWTIDPQDFRQKPPTQIAQFVIDRLRPGSVILLHDHKNNCATDTSGSAEALRLILQAAASRNLTCATISDVAMLPKQP